MGRLSGSGSGVQQPAALLLARGKVQSRFYRIATSLSCMETGFTTLKPVYNVETSFTLNHVYHMETGLTTLKPVYHVETGYTTLKPICYAEPVLPTLSCQN